MALRRIKIDPKEARQNRRGKDTGTRLPAEGPLGDRSRLVAKRTALIPAFIHTPEGQILTSHGRASRPAIYLRKAHCTICVPIGRLGISLASYPPGLLDSVSLHRQHAFQGNFGNVIGMAPPRTGVNRASATAG